MQATLQSQTLRMDFYHFFSVKINLMNEETLLVDRKEEQVHHVAMTSVSPFDGSWISTLSCISSGSRILTRRMTCVYIDFQKTGILYLRVVSQQLNIVQVSSKLS